MKFLNFPALVHLEIIKQLSDFDVILLSLCSRRTMQTLKKCNKKNREIWIAGTMECMDFYFRNGPNFKYIFYLGLQESKEGGELNFKLDKKKVGYSLGEYKTIFIHEKANITPFHHNICEMFNTPPEFFLRTSKSNQINTFYPRNVLSKSYLDYSKSTLKDMNKFYELYTGQFFSEVNFIEYSFGLEERKKFFEVLSIRNLILRKTIFTGYEIFDKFRGEHGYFENMSIYLFRVNTWIRHWILRKGGNWKSLIFKTQEFHTLNVDELNLGELVSEKWDPSRRERFFKYDTPIKQYESLPPELFDCANGIDIIRSKDKKLATIRVLPEYFAFFVWP